MNDAVTLDHDLIYEASSTDESSCGESQVTLEASGAPANGSYNWYEEESSSTPIDGQHGSSFVTPTLTKSLTYYVAAVNSLGCEGARVAVRADVTAAIVPVTITGAETGQFESSYAEGNQWYLDGEIIEGATNQTLEATESGTYTVEVGVNGCVVAATVDFLITGIDEFNPGRLLNAYMNPFVDVLKIRIATPKKVEQMSIYDNLGAKVGDMALKNDGTGTEGIIDMTGSASGMYFVKTLVEDRVYTLKVIKK
jgi:hypothetical protein